MENISRSQNAELAEGATDGTYKKIVRDRGGSVDPATYAARAAFDDYYYGFHEKRVKVLGDGTLHATPDYAATPAANQSGW